MYSIGRYEKDGGPPKPPRLTFAGLIAVCVIFGLVVIVSLVLRWF